MVLTKTEVETLVKNFEVLDQETKTRKRTLKHQMTKIDQYLRERDKVRLKDQSELLKSLFQ